MTLPTELWHGKKTELNQHGSPLVGSRLQVTASVADAALAAIATFAAALYAARFLPLAELGFYALVFAAFVLGAVIPRQLAFLPVELWSAGKSSLPVGLLQRALAAGAFAGIIGGLPIPIAMRIAGQQPGTAQLLPTLLNAWALTLISPAQDHLRRMLHILGRSRSAAAVSAAQAAVVIGSLAGFHSVGAKGAWIPFCALLVANAVSTMVALPCTAAGPRSGEAVPRVLEFLRTGRWLLLVGLIPTGTGLAVAAIVTLKAGAEALGIAEAAAIVARPLSVLATGLSAVLGPRSVAAARSANKRLANHVVYMNTAIVLGSAIAYGSIVSAPSSWNPMVKLMPGAYSLTGIVALTLVAATVDGLATPYLYELMGARRARLLAAIEAGGNAGRASIATLGASLGAFVLPLGSVVLATTRAIGGLVSRRVGPRSIGDASRFGLGAR